MKYYCFSFLLCLLFCTNCTREKSINRLSEKEITDGWLLLWDGKSFDGWRGIYKDFFPDQGWVIENDELICLGNEVADSIRGGDIITKKKIHEL